MNHLRADPLFAAALRCAARHTRSHSQHDKLRGRQGGRDINGLYSLDVGVRGGSSSQIRLECRNKRMSGEAEICSRLMNAAVRFRFAGSPWAACRAKAQPHTSRSPRFTAVRRRVNFSVVVIADFTEQDPPRII